jgi:hypothetical protein
VRVASEWWGWRGLFEAEAANEVEAERDGEEEEEAESDGEV